MAGLERYLRILKLFDQDAGEWTVPGMAKAIDVPASTVYRIVRELVAQGFLDQSVETRYRLGAAFIEFDRRVRLTSPLIRFGEPILEQLARNVDTPAVAVLAQMYNDQVICVADVHTAGRKVQSSYERGKPMPLLRGATSKAILAQLSSRELQKLLVASTTPDSQYDIPHLRQELKGLLKRGFCVTHGEVDPDLVGIAAPVFHQGSGIAASLSLVVRADDYTRHHDHHFIMNVAPAARLLSDALDRSGKDSPTPVHDQETV
jgi:DNA-binding IclR family transcriptional regulator